MERLVRKANKTFANFNEFKMACKNDESLKEIYQGYLKQLSLFFASDTLSAHITKVLKMIIKDILSDFSKTKTIMSIILENDNNELFDTFNEFDSNFSTLIERSLTLKIRQYFNSNNIEFADVATITTICKLNYIFRISPVMKEICKVATAEAFYRVMCN